MYRTTSDMIEGWTKNLALLFPKPIALAALAHPRHCCSSSASPSWRFGIFWLVPWQRWRHASHLGAHPVALLRRVARSNFPALDVAISILGVPLFVWLLVRSSFDHRIQKDVAWKGRSYNTTHLTSLASCIHTLL